MMTILKKRRINFNLHFNRILFILAALLVPYISKAQYLKPYNDKIFGIHISIPELWTVFYEADTTNPIFTVNEKIGFDDETERVVLRLERSYTNDQFIKKCNEEKCIADSIIFKSFTTRRYGGSNYLSEKYPQMSYATTSFILEAVIHGSMETWKKVYYSMLFIHNDDVFTLKFICSDKTLDKFKPLFLNIANSIYFD